MNTAHAQMSKPADKPSLSRVHLVSFFLGVSVLLSILGCTECKSLEKYAANHHDDVIDGNPTLNFNEDFDVYRAQDQIRGLDEDSERADDSIYDSVNKRSRFGEFDLEKVLRNIEDDKQKRIDRMKFYGSIGKRSQVSTLGSESLNALERYIAKKSKQYIDHIRFKGHIGK